MKRKILGIGVLMLLLVLVLSGCFIKTVDELYALPKHSDEYNNLQQAIDQLMAQGAAYSAPVSGVNQQSVQLADLDGDGEDEAIVFLKTGGEKPLLSLGSTFKGSLPVCLYYHNLHNFSSKIACLFVNFV